MNEAELLIFPAFVVIAGLAAWAWMHFDAKRREDGDSRR